MRRNDAEARAGFEPRAQCARCERPVVVCVCAHVPRLETTTRLLLLQHRRERRVPIGTAGMAHRALVGSELRIGVDFEADPVVRAFVEAEPPTFVLFPSADAVDVSTLATAGPLRLIALDGTWALAKKLLRVNPWLARLPRLRFTPRAPSGYRIRREPPLSLRRTRSHCERSTLKAP